MNVIIFALALACGDMTSFQMPGMAVTIMKAEKTSDNLPARCRLDGVIDQRTGGKTYGIGFAVALPVQLQSRSAQVQRRQNRGMPERVTSGGHSKGFRRP